MPCSARPSTWRPRPRGGEDVDLRADVYSLGDPLRHVVRPAAVRVRRARGSARCTSAIEPAGPSVTARVRSAPRDHRDGRGLILKAMVMVRTSGYQNMGEMRKDPARFHGSTAVVVTARPCSPASRRGRRGPSSKKRKADRRARMSGSPMMRPIYRSSRPRMLALVETAESCLPRPRCRPPKRSIWRTLWTAPDDDVVSDS